MDGKWHLAEGRGTWRSISIEASLQHGLESVAIAGTVPPNLHGKLDLTFAQDCRTGIGQEKVNLLWIR